MLLITFRNKAKLSLTWDGHSIHSSFACLVKMWENVWVSVWLNHFSTQFQVVSPRNFTEYMWSLPTTPSLLFCWVVKSSSFFLSQSEKGDCPEEEGEVEVISCEKEVWLSRSLTKWPILFREIDSKWNKLQHVLPQLWKWALAKGLKDKADCRQVVSYPVLLKHANVRL